MAPGTTHDRTEGRATDLLDPQDPFRSWRDLQDPVEGTTWSPPTPAGLPDAPAVELGDLDALDHPRRVLSESYVGIDRRRPGRLAAAVRATYASRRSLLRLDVLIVVAVAAVVVGAALLVAAPPAARPHRVGTEVAAALPSDTLRDLTRTTPARSTSPAPAATTAAAPTVSTAPAVSAAPAVTVPPVTAPPPDLSTPDGMGAAALALVRYPWQQLPGYSIRFLPIADAPSAGFYGNTTFTWGQQGGVSTLYVYPGETVQQLAGITAFEIGHEVDAAFVEPQGGHAAISAILGVDPPSWAPECDCAEQGYLSGWYAAAFSDYWSPGVGDWSTLAPPPSGATLAAVKPWLDPRLS